MSGTQNEYGSRGDTGEHTAHCLQSSLSWIKSVHVGTGPALCSSLTLWHSASSLAFLHRLGTVSLQIRIISALLTSQSRASQNEVGCGSDHGLLSHVCLSEGEIL